MLTPLPAPRAANRALILATIRTDNPETTMHHFLTQTLAAAALAAAGSAFAAPIAIDLSSWSERGPADNGNWVVAPDGQSVLQTINGDPTFFVSDSDQINTTLRGRIRVGADGDDDYVGFVFGFNGPVANGNDMNYWLFDWKQNTQEFGGQTAQEGFAVSRVNGTITDYLPGFWGHNSSAAFNVLATQYGDNLGWVDNVEYDFTILYQENRLKIDIAGGAFGSGTTVFDLAGSFGSGRFGFYNYSQSSVRYSGLTEEDTPPPPPPHGVPLPGTLGLAALGLALGLAPARRRRGRSGPQALQPRC
jgi:hypothetical protein